MTRGEVWWAELEGDAGFRPVVIVSSADSLARRHNVTIAEVTRSLRGLPSEVRLSTADGLPVNCAINADHLHTIPKDRFRRRIAALSDERIFSLDAALRHALGLEW